MQKQSQASVHARSFVDAAKNHSILTTNCWGVLETESLASEIDTTSKSEEVSFLPRSFFLKYAMHTKESKHIPRSHG